jgi:hypothetical protein
MVQQVNKHQVRLEVITVELMKIQDFWDLMACPPGHRSKPSEAP